MANSSPFISRAHRYESNYRDAAGLNVRPARLERPGGQLERGVCISILDRQILVIPRDAAYTLAKQIADILTDDRKDTTE